MQRADVQGLIFSAYSRRRYSAVCLVRLREGDASLWLSRLIGNVSSAQRGERFASASLNLAFTARGLARIGLENSVLNGFASEFLQGAAHAERCRSLGDVGKNAPELWQFADLGVRAVDAVVLVYASSAMEREQQLEQLTVLARRSGVEIEVNLSYWPEEARGHFGYRMLATDPTLERGARRRNSGRPCIKAGEFVLGHRDELRERATGPEAPWLRSTREPPPLRLSRRSVDLGFNGSYLVVRKLAQDVATFRALARMEELRSGLTQERVLANWMGRFPDGTPLQAQPSQACPLTAHAARAGAWDVPGLEPKRHRLLRRSRLYGPDRAGEAQAMERGLWFMALNADIARQFEFVRGNLLNDSRLFGRSGETCPIAGTRDELLAVRQNLPQWLTVRGALYCFLPGLRALGYLADSARRARSVRGFGGPA